MKKLFLTNLFFLAAMMICYAMPQYLVVAPAPSKFEQTAEAELQLFWQQLYGRKLEKISAAEAKNKAAIKYPHILFTKNKEII